MKTREQIDIQRAEAALIARRITLHQIVARLVGNEPVGPNELSVAMDGIQQAAVDVAIERNKVRPMSEFLDPLEEKRVVDLGKVLDIAYGREGT